jgi:acyl-CoA reductase-like NAD-dependent aldehyde dehydrogenase
LEQLLARSPGRLQEAVFSKDPFGLGGGVVTRDEHVTTEIECGSVFVNDIVRSDPRLPSA